MRLYDRIDREEDEKERRSPTCAILVLILFTILFASLTLFSFRRSTATFLETKAAELERRAAKNEEALETLASITKKQVESTIPEILKTRFIVTCTTELNFDKKSQKGFVDIKKAAMDELETIKDVHFITFTSWRIRIDKDYASNPDRYVKYRSFVKRHSEKGSKHTDGYKLKLEFNNVDSAEGKICFLVSGYLKKK